jgi:hypothetical protein
MSKKKTEVVEDTELDWEEDDEYSEDQYEYSYEMANDYVSDTLLPDLMKFDLENEDEDYVPGTALFTAFVQMASILLENGFTPDQLKDVVDEFEVQNTGMTIH